MKRLFNLYGGKKGYLDEKEAKLFILDVLSVCELVKEIPNLEATIDGIYKELDPENLNKVYLKELLKPSWGKVQDILNTVYRKMNKLNGKGPLRPAPPPVPKQPESSLSESDYEECCPPSFICPISTEIMNDPVILVEIGTTYDRKSIERWLTSHNSDPSTGLDIKSKDLLPVLALKNAIEEWKNNLKEKQKLKKLRRDVHLKENSELVSLNDHKSLNSNLKEKTSQVYSHSNSVVDNLSS